MAKCTECRGVGRKTGDCPTCVGLGWKPIGNCGHTETCKGCRGRGYALVVCSNCNGRTYV